MKLTRIGIVLTVLVAGSVFAAGGAHANCTNRACSGEKLTSLSVRTNGSVYVSLTGNVANLDCRRIEGRYLRLERSHPGFHEIFSLLLEAKFADHDVWIRIRTNAQAGRAQPCTVRYAVLESQQPHPVLAFLKDGTVGGKFGLYLKQVGGPVLARHNAAFRFEPASAIKALIHFHAMRLLQEGAMIGGEPVTLGRQIPYFTDLLGSDMPPGGCPALTGRATDTLREGLRQMMRNSDNRWTQALRDFFGDRNIGATRDDLGMRNSRLSHVIGCFEAKPDGYTSASEDPNALTLVDTASMYEEVATGFLTPAWRRQAFDLMSTDNTRFNNLIDEQAVGMDLSAGALADFKDARDAVLKTGAYRKPGLSPPREYRAVAGWVSIAWKDANCALVPREYVYGAFIHRAETVPGHFEGSIRDAGVELFREQMTAALASWAACG